jgi:hypothetical protein
MCAEATADVVDLDAVAPAEIRITGFRNLTAKSATADLAGSPLRANAHGSHLRVTDGNGAQARVWLAPQGDG